MCPTRRVDDVGECSVLEDNAGVVPPWTAEVESTSLHCITGGSRDLRLIDDVVRRVGGRVAAIGCDVAKRSSEYTDVYTIEPSGSLLSEDEVGST